MQLQHRGPLSLVHAPADVTDAHPSESAHAVVHAPYDITAPLGVYNMVQRRRRLNSGCCGPLPLPVFMLFAKVKKGGGEVARDGEGSRGRREKREPPEGKRDRTGKWEQSDRGHVASAGVANAPQGAVTVTYSCCLHLRDFALRNVHTHKYKTYKNNQGIAKLPRKAKKKKKNNVNFQATGPGT